VLIDGSPTGSTVSAGGTVTIGNVNVGNVEVGVKEGGGQITNAPNAAAVRRDQTTYVWIERGTQGPQAHPEGGFNVFKPDGSSAEGFRVITPVGSEEFNVIRPNDYENWLMCPVYFEPDSAVLIEAYRPALDSVGRYLAANPELRLLIRAYTSPFGTSAGRLMVSEWRANFSRDYMVEEYGVSTNRITAELYGSERIPQEVAAASTWVSYRCVELIIY
jgi:outer membrane protein OmpA-like peptidoglycan-associated protein